MTASVASYPNKPSLAINHPFIDSEKRVAFAAADVFLRVNGWRLQAEPLQIHAAMIQVLESGTFNTARFEPCLRGCAKDET